MESKEIDKHNPRGLHFVRQGDFTESNRAVCFLNLSTIIGKKLKFYRRKWIVSKVCVSGRDDSAHVKFSSKSVSREHCKVELLNGRMFIENIKVKNETLNFDKNDDSMTCFTEREWDIC